MTPREALTKAAEIALIYRDEADHGAHPDVRDPDHSLGQGFAANFIAKRILTLRDSLPEELETDLHGRLCDLQYKSLTDIANELADIADALDSTNALRADQIAALAHRVAAARQQPESAPSQVPAQPDASLKASLQRDAAFMRRAQGAEKAADELRQEIRRKRALAQRLDASHDECCQREASAAQRAEAAERDAAELRHDLARQVKISAELAEELAKMRAEHEPWGFVKVQSGKDVVWLHISDGNRGGYSINLDAVSGAFWKHAKRCADHYRAMLAASQPTAEREEKQ